MNPTFIRIGLRYVAGYLAFKALLPPDIAAMLAEDQEVVGAIGIGLGALVEGAYVLAKKLGWRT